jgi:2-(1,2-epoxy-1,2-dihydrophenyl)acetyl-CoA isomerase
MSLVVSEPMEDGVWRIAINRPDVRNAISPDTRLELIAAYTQALDDPAVSAIVMGSTEGHFSSGGDIRTMGRGDARDARARMKLHHRFVRMIAEAQKPLVAAIEGYAMGAGAGLALFADTVVLAEGGAIGFPFFKVGLTPDFAIPYTLTRRLGWAKARQLLIYARTVRGAAAVEMGLADVLAPNGQAEAKALELAKELAAMPPMAFSLTKMHLLNEPRSLQDALEAEATAQPLCATGPEHAEGRAAFKEQRKPDFRNV